MFPARRLGKTPPVAPRDTNPRPKGGRPRGTATGPTANYRRREPTQHEEQWTEGNDQTKPISHNPY